MKSSALFKVVLNCTERMWWRVFEAEAGAGLTEVLTFHTCTHRTLFTQHSLWQDLAAGYRMEDGGKPATAPHRWVCYIEAWQAW